MPNDKKCRLNSFINLNKKNNMKKYLMFLAVALCLQTVALDKPKLHLPEKINKVKVVHKPGGEWLYLGIPSPGNNYDELKYDVKIGVVGGKTYMQSTLFLTPQSDMITFPYVRLLYTNGVEFAMMSFSNATFRSNGGKISKSIRLPFLPRKYYIACGYAGYYDPLYNHMQGRSEETVIDALNGKIIYRGPLRNIQNLEVEIENKSGLVFRGETIHARVLSQNIKNSTGGIEQINIDYDVYNSETGSKIHFGKDVTDIVFRPKNQGNYLLVLTAGTDFNVLWRKMQLLTVLPKFIRKNNPNALGVYAINDSVGCGLSNTYHHLTDGRTDETFTESTVTDRLPGSRRTNILSKTGRIVCRNRGFFGYNIGNRLKRNMPYLLEIEYPEDVPRTFAFIIGDSTYTPGIHTGYTLGQPEPRFFVEQINFPLSKKIHKAKFIVWAGDDEVKNGFYVGIADPGSRNAPLSRKPAIISINLYEFYSVFFPKINRTFPKEYQRYAMTQSEDSLPRDDVRFSPLVNAAFYGLNSVSPQVLAWNGHGEANNTLLIPSLHYRQPIRKFLNNVEFETDQMENATNKFNFWAEYLRWANKLNLNVFPCFEYGGSDDLPKDARAINQDGNLYPPIVRSFSGEKIGDSVDVCNPEVIKDAEMIIDEIINGAEGDSLANLKELIVRRRANFLPVSFSTNAMQLFESETKTNLKGKDFDEKRKFLVKNYLSEYQKWFQKQLFVFLDKLQQHYKNNINFPINPMLYYHWKSSGMPYQDLYYRTYIDWEKNWKKIRNLDFEGDPLPELDGSKLTSAITNWTETEDGLYLDLVPSNSVLPIAPIYGKVAAENKHYLEQFNINGQTAVKIVPAVHSNTKIYRKKRGLFIAGQTMYHSREFSMYEPILAFCNSNPKYMIFEQAHPACFPFPEYSRNFFANFLSLPAIPLKVIEQTSNASDLVVKIGTLDSKTYIAIANPTFKTIAGNVKVPVEKIGEIIPLVGNRKAIPFFIESDGISFPEVIEPLELKTFLLK